MEKDELKAAIEGLLFASGDEGVSVGQLSRVLNTTNKYTESLLSELDHDYQKKDRGILLLQNENNYYLTTKPEYGIFLRKLLETPQSLKLSRAGLETLAIIAYQQPITKLEIEEIRGVNSHRSIQTLLARSLIKEIGRKEAIGRPILFGTTLDFLTYFGLVSLDELPPLRENISSEELKKEADLFFDRFNHIDNSKD